MPRLCKDDLSYPGQLPRRETRRSICLPKPVSMSDLCWRRAHLAKQSPWALSRRELRDQLFPVHNTRLRRHAEHAKQKVESTQDGEGVHHKYERALLLSKRAPHRFAGV